MLTSWSEQSTPAELSIASVLIRPPASANSTTSLGEAEVAALTDDAAAQLAGVDAHLVVALVPHVGVGLRRGLDVGADAAVPAGRPAPAGQRGSTRRGEGILGNVQPGLDLRGDRTVFAVRGKTPPPAEISDGS